MIGAERISADRCREPVSYERPCACGCGETTGVYDALAPDCRDRYDDLRECVELCDESSRWLSATYAALRAVA